MDHKWHSRIQREIRGRSDDSLAYGLQDLNEVIEAQEAMARAGFKTPKLDQYLDERHYVCMEITIRRKAA
jgi:hypothetical protein